MGHTDSQGAPALLRNVAFGNVAPGDIVWDELDGGLLLARTAGNFAVGNARSKEGIEEWREAAITAVTEAQSWGLGWRDVGRQLADIQAGLGFDLQVIAKQPEIRRSAQCPICGREKGRGRQGTVARLA